MGERLRGRNAIVTGASRGIGAAAAERLAAEGANVAITARTFDDGDGLPGTLLATAERLRRYGNGVVTIVADMADENDRTGIVPTAADGLGGPIDILVNNAAAGIYQSMLDYPARRLRTMFEVNVNAVVSLVQAVVPGMLARGEGWIVNLTSSSAALHEGPPFRTTSLAMSNGVYGASKAALNRITSAFAVELQGTGIRINAVRPRATVWTDAAEALLGGAVDDDRLESMEAMVEAIVALCECEPDRTGQVLVSLELLDELARTVMALDGASPHPGGQRAERSESRGPAPD